MQSYFVDTILPNVAGLLNDGESSPGNLLCSVEEEQDFIDMIKRIVVQCTPSPHGVVANHLYILMLPFHKVQI